MFIPIDRFKIYLGLESATLTTADSERLTLALRAATEQIQQIAGRRFFPRFEPIAHPITHPTELSLEDDLVSISSITQGDGTTVPPHDYEVEYGGIVRLKNGVVWRSNPNGDPRPITVTGYWGWHPDPLRLFRSSGDTLTQNAGLSGTILQVSNVNGTTPNGEQPRFRVGQLLRAQSEYLRLIGVNTTLNQLTVVRAVQGTSAQNQLAEGVIEVYQIPSQVEWLILRWANLLYKDGEGRDDGSIPLSLIREAESLARVRV
ncbi:MAG: hypothetical protein MUF87_17345 [Anaerolineae bacterium]|nr:hypothetical protein [Anaerolineae bacterium]